jgi:pyruvate kinase
MLTRIAEAVENQRAKLPRRPFHISALDESGLYEDSAKSTPKALLASVALELANFDAVLVPTRYGTSARVISRMRLPVWTLATSTNENALQSLCFSAGVHPVYFEQEPDSWNEAALRLTREAGLACRHVLLVAGPSAHNHMRINVSS